MKKQFAAWALFLFMALPLATGCANTMKEETKAFELYFQAADLYSAAGADALQKETIYLEDAEGQEPEQLATRLLTKLLEGPSNETMQSTIPTGTSLLSVQVDGSRAYVDLSTAYSTLSGIALTMADYAITLTLTQLSEISRVYITVRGEPLAYRDKQSFTAEDVLLSSTEDVVGTIDVTLYFLDENGTLQGEKRTLSLYEGDTQVAVVMKALQNGPERKALYPVLPEELYIQSVWLEEDVCYVNLSSSSIYQLPDEADLETALHAVVQSLRSLDTVSEVQFLVDGEFAEEYGEISAG